MALRVTPNQTVTQFLSQLTNQNSRLRNLQQQATSGLRISRPSDDPSGLLSVLRAEEAITQLQTRTSTISTTRFRLEQANVSVLEAERLFIKAETLASQAVQLTEPEELSILANEVDAILRQVTSIANSEVGGEYLFSGATTGQKPFTVNNEGQLVYSGSSAPRTLQLHEGATSVILKSGAEVFQSTSRTPTLYLGDTGATAGYGTDNGRGRGELIVRHDTTTFAPGSGVAAGTDSPNGDSIVGAAGIHRLQIIDQSGTGAFGTVTLNGGQEVSFTNGDVNLEIKGPGGEVVYLDTSNITAGFSGEIEITATGTLSTDDGLTEVPIDFSANQSVIDSRTGAVTNVNATAIDQSGIERLEYSGTTDAFEVLRQLRDDIRNISNLQPSEHKADIGRRITDLKRVRNHFLDVVGEQSVTLSQLDTVEIQIEDVQLELERQVSETGSADITKVALQLQQAQSQLQYTLATASTLFDVSLLEFLR